MHFGVILILKGGLGSITPPIGSVLFVGTAIGQHQHRRSAEDDLAVLPGGTDRVADRRVRAGAVAVVARSAEVTSAAERRSYLRGQSE